MTLRELLVAASSMSAILICSVGFHPICAQDSPEFLEAMDQAELLSLKGDFKGAVKAYRQADRLSKGMSYPCQLGMAKAFNKIGAFKNARECAQRALDLAEGATAEASAYNQLGQALYARGTAKPEGLLAAVKAFQRTIDLAPEEGNIARFNQGLALLRLERDQEGVAVLNEFLARQPAGHEAELARPFVANPLRARVPLLPEFEIVTLDGEYVTSADLEGKVVLLDFWGTWCGPCVAAIPHLRGLSRKSAKNPFVLLSVSNDHDETLLREFIVEHEMTWPQFWDEKRELIQALDVRTYPTYVLIDPAGKIIYRRSGWSDRVAYALSTEVSRQLRAARRLRQ